MINNKPSFFCRVCGLNQQEYTWGEDNNSPTFGICACCGTEFGYHDSSLDALRAQRQRWLLNDGKWSDIKDMPTNWSLSEQMKNIPKEYL